MGETDRTDDPLLGTELGRYRLERLIGRGGMGRVYLGVRPDIGSRVAIKVLSADCAENPALVERFFTEARAVNLIAHENIVSVIDLDRTGRPFIVMEYVEGHTLRSLLETGPLPLGGVVEVIHDVLLGLEAAHTAGIIHRDLKPDNVIVTALGRAKLLDFGIAKLAERPGVRTATGMVLGTPNYMAPEQIRGATCDARTDVYALGVMMFELVTGQRPFHGDTDFALMEHHVRTPAPSAVALRPDLPEAIADVISRALAKVPTDRYPSALAMADELRTATAGLELAPFAPAALRPASVMPASTSSPTAETAIEPPRAAPPPKPIERDLNAATQDLAAPTRPGKSGARQPAPPAPKQTRQQRIVPLILLAMTVGGVVAAIAVVVHVARQPDVAAPDAAVLVAAIDAAIPLDAAMVAELEPGATLVDAAIVVDDSPTAGASRQKKKVPAAPPDPQCAGTKACTVFGSCAFVGGECKPSVAGCAASTTCRTDGRCSLVEGTCKAGSAADCKQSGYCKVDNYCKYEDHLCVPPDDAACARSNECKQTGRCKLGGTECIATPTSCRDSTDCLNNGRCRYENRRCFAERMVPDSRFTTPGGR